MTRWELSFLEDPYDIRRVRLLYQWQVGHISFEQLDKAWSEIRDRALLDASGKPVLGGDGRPKFLALPLPVTPRTRRDWITRDASASATGMSGHQAAIDPLGLTAVWVSDPEAASQFGIAVVSAMANSRVRARWGDAAMMTP